MSALLSGTLVIRVMGFECCLMLYAVYSVSTVLSHYFIVACGLARKGRENKV
jgi:hypothetical protein